MSKVSREVKDRIVHIFHESQSLSVSLEKNQVGPAAEQTSRCNLLQVCTVILMVECNPTEIWIELILKKTGFV